MSTAAAEVDPGAPFSLDPGAPFSLDPGAPFSLEPYHVSPDLGFVLSEPLEELPLYYQPWTDVALKVPQLVENHQLRNHIHKMPELSSESLRSHRELRLAHLTLGVMTMGYVWQEGETGTVHTLPRNLAVPYWEVSQRLGLPPIFTHADGVLANWRKKDPEGGFTVPNLELLLSLPGGDSVRGFFMVTLMVELAAAPALRNFPAVINGVRGGDCEAVGGALEEISQSLQDMTDALKLMHEFVEPSVFYGIMRIFLSGWKDNPIMPLGLIYEGVGAEPVEFSGGSAAQSSLLHCLDQLLGVRHQEESGSFLERMRDYMPPAHKQLILDLSAEPSLRDFVRSQASDRRLAEAFRLCVAKLLAFRSYHIHVVARYISTPAAHARRLRRRQGGEENVESQAPGAKEGEERAVSRAPSALEEHGTGGTAIMGFLKSVRDRTRIAFVPPQPES